MITIFTSIVHWWTSLPQEAQVALIGVGLKYAVASFKQFAPQLTSREIHAVTMIGSFSFYGVAALTQGGVTNGYLPLIASALSSALMAVGWHETTKPADTAITAAGLAS